MSKLGSNHQTPEQRQEAINALDELDPNASDPEDDETQDDENADDEEVTSDSENDDTSADSADDENADDENQDDSANADDSNPEIDPETGKPKVKKSEDFQKKFQDSSREAQVLALRNQTYEQKIEAAENLPDPSDEQCRSEYGEAWDKKDSADKVVLRQALKGKQYQEIIRSARKEQKEEQEYYNTANTFAIDPKNLKLFPSLDGRQDEFARFASKSTRRGLDLEDVAAIFITSRPVRKKAPAGAMMERTNATSNKNKPAPKTLNAQQAGTLRNVDQRTYQSQIRSGKIKPADLLKQFHLVLKSVINCY